LARYKFEDLKPYKLGSFVYVDTAEKLAKCTDALSKESIVGVDLENSYASYNGFSALIQISSYGLNGAQPTTYIIDVMTSEIRPLITGTIGAKVLGNPKVLKLLHACIASDLPWLIRDYGVVCQPVFDTQDFYCRAIQRS